MQALDDVKAGHRRKGLLRDFNIDDPRQGRRLCPNVLYEAPDFGLSPCDLYFDSIRLVPHPAGQMKIIGQLKNKGSESDPLNNSMDANADTPVRSY
jgi:hypothetical protein